MMFSFFGASANDKNASRELSRFQQVKEFKDIELILSQIIAKKDELANKGAKIMASPAYKMMIATERFTSHTTDGENGEKFELEKVDRRPVAIRKAEVLVGVLKLIDERIKKFNEGSKSSNIFLEKKSKYFLVRDLVIMIDNVLVKHCDLLNIFRPEDEWIDWNVVTHYGSRAAGVMVGGLLASPAGVVAAAVGLASGAIGGAYLEQFIKSKIDIGKAPASLRLLVNLQEAITREGIVLELDLGGELSAKEFSSDFRADQDDQEDNDSNENNKSKSSVVKIKTN